MAQQINGEPPRSENQQIENKQIIDLNNHETSETYEQKVERILAYLDNFQYPYDQANYLTLIIQNYDILRKLFQENEQKRKEFVKEIVDFQESLQEFKTECDLKLSDEKLRNLELEKKIKLFATENKIENVLSSFEEDYQKLQTQLFEEQKENQKLYSLIFNELELKLTNNENYQQLFTLKQTMRQRIDQLTKQVIQKQKEISSFQQKERKLASQTKVMDNINNKNISVMKKIQVKEQNEKQLIDICNSLQKQNEELKAQKYKHEEKCKQLEQQLSAADKKMLLFREMATKPTDDFVKRITQKYDQSKEVSMSLRDPLKGSERKFTKNQRNQIYSNLKSLMN